MSIYQHANLPSAPALSILIAHFSSTGNMSWSSGLLACLLCFCLSAWTKGAGKNVWNSCKTSRYIEISSVVLELEVRDAITAGMLKNKRLGRYDNDDDDGVDGVDDDDGVDDGDDDDDNRHWNAGSGSGVVMLTMRMMKRMEIDLCVLSLTRPTAPLLLRACEGDGD
eukprot:765441-Hanusia_phi.AAC.7